MKSNYILRLESDIKRVISEIITFEVKNNVGFVTVTDCELTPDQEYLTIFYTVLSKKDKSKAKEGLESAKGFIKAKMLERVQMRVAPKITFKYDDSYENGERIEELLREINNK